MPSNRPTKSERVTAVVTPETKAEWEQHCPPHGHEFSGMSDLIRTAVYRELNGHHEPTIPDSSGVDTELIADMTTSLSSLTSSTEEISERLRRVEELSRTQSPTYKLENVVMDLLPVGPRGEESATTVTTLVQRYGFDREEVTEALNQLLERTNEVVRDVPPTREWEPDPEPMFYKRGGN